MACGEPCGREARALELEQPGRKEDRETRRRGAQKQCKEAGSRATSLSALEHLAPWRGPGSGAGKQGCLWSSGWREWRKCDLLVPEFRGVQSRCREEV